MTSKIFNIKNTFSISEKIIFIILFFAFIISGYFLLSKVLEENFIIEVPKNGGVLREGLIGTPRFINPILAISDTDRDLTTLIYSGLTRISYDGQIIPDLAEKYEISEDGLTYTFYLKPDLEFHDGTQITTEDIAFTIENIQNAEIKSPKRSNWEGVAVEKIDDLTIQFTLNEPYPPFLENTSVGILPKNLWQDISANEFALTNFNLSPIGSGPYQIEKINKNEYGIATSYVLKSFKNFSLGEPYLKKIEFYFAKNEKELLAMYNQKQIEAIHSINPETARGLELAGVEIKRYVLPRIFSVFFNQNTSTALSNNSVRQALKLITPQKEIISEVMYGYAEIANTPYGQKIQIDKSEMQIDKIAKAQNILEKGGWEKNEDGIYIREKADGDMQMLSFSLTTANVPELVSSAEKIVSAWNQIGAKVELKILESSDFNQNTIRARDFDAVLFGMIISRPSDLYAFWHSSQRNDPGLNISGYTNITSDAALEKLRSETHQEKINILLDEINTEMNKDLPALFLYSPQFIYVIPSKIKNLQIENITAAEQRFANVYKWYTETDKILKFLTNNK